MSTFGDNRYCWRETYFVLFKSSDRPSLKVVEKAVTALNERYVLKDASADDAGLFDSLTLLSPDDYAALDISYLAGAEALEQSAEMVGKLEPAACVLGETIPKEQLLQYDGRFDVLHFEQAPEERVQEDDPDEMLDPSALLLVLGVLAKLTDGIAVDPQTGTVLSDDD